MWTYCLGFFVHFILILSAVDIFFRNHISYGEWKCNSKSEIAKRLVFILVDGLDQQELVREATGSVAAAINGQGTWGSIIGAGIPSQYAGSQALISGFTVDPLKTYLTRFIFEDEPIDSFMNKSQSVFYFGTKDYYKYIHEGQKKWWTYFHPSWENSIVLNVTLGELGNLTVAKAHDLFSSKINETLKESLNRKQTTFFIQLGFVARTGQLFGFNSNDTSLAVSSLFSTIERLVSSIEEYYNKDNKTVFILCSNYRPEDGYQAILSHKEWKNLFVSWGPGIANNQNKVLIHQNQVAPLVSALLGLDVPRNSRGVIPFSVTNFSVEAMAEAQLCNTMHLYNLAIDTDSCVPFRLSYHNDSPEYVHNILQNYLSHERYSELYNLSEYLTVASLRDIHFNESVYKHAVWYCSLFTLLGWILLICSDNLPYRDSLDNKSIISYYELKVRLTSRFSNINNHMRSVMRIKKDSKQIITDKSHMNSEIEMQETSFTQKPLQENINEKLDLSTSNTIQIENPPRRSLITWKWLRGVTDIFFIFGTSGTFMVTFFLKWSPIFTYYMVMPIILFWLLSYTIVDWVIFAKEYFLKSWKQYLIYVLLFLLTCWIIIRGCNQVITLLFGIIMMLQSILYVQKSSWSVTFTWLISGSFILILTEKGLWISTAPIEWALATSILLLIVWNLYATFRLNPKGIDLAVASALLWQNGMGLGCVLFSDSIHAGGHETPYVLKLLSWFSFSFIFLPAIHRNDPSALVINICIALSTPFILLSTAFEPLFFLLMSNFMISWMILEGYTDEGKVKRQLNGDDARRAILFVYFFFVCNEVLKNNYSLVNDNIYSIRCFTETINEPMIWFIMLMKPLIIYILLTVIYLIICLSNGVKVVQGFNLVLIIFQLLILKLFFLIQANENGDLSRFSLSAATQYFILNILTIFLMSVVLICKYIYRLPMPKAV